MLAAYPAPAHAQTDVVTADFVPAKTTFLSSERPRGRLRIFNGSNEPLSFNHVYGTTSEGSRVNGGLPYRELLEIISTRSSDIVSIPPHASYEDDVSLARCTLLSQPCSVAAVLSVSLWRPGADTFVVKTPAHSYDIVADPTATFDDRGLSGNRPLIVAQGGSSDVLDLDSLVIEIRPASAGPRPASSEPALVEAARAIAARDGVTIAGTGTSAEGQDWYATITVRRPSAQREQIAKLLADLDRELAPRVRSITHSVSFDRFAFDPVLGRAAVEAQLEARRFAEVIGVVPLQPSWLAAEDFFTVGDRNPFSSLDVMEPQGIDYGEVVSGPQSVRVRTTVVRAGSRTVAPAIVAAPTLDAEFEGQAVELADWPDIHATIEADRPELFVAAGTDEDRVLAAGRVPEQVALAYARRRADMFASLLGARLGIVSMVVLPRLADQFSGVRIRSLGLAMTMEPPVPLSSVVPGAATPSPAPRGAPQASPLPFAPIDVAGTERTISTKARIEVPAVADAQRVVVTILPIGEAPAPSSVASRLKREPLVSDIAVEGGVSRGERAVYALVVRSMDPATRTRIVDVIREAYGESAQTLNEVDTRLIRDCAPLERRVVSEAIAQACALAAARATASHVRLSRLLLAVEHPFGADFDGCFDHAEAPALRSAPGYFSAGNLSVWGSVSLTFRTQPEP